LSEQWLGSSQGKPETLEAILEITSEFPSLRRRMVAEWADRFGIHGDDYSHQLQSLRSVDAVDLYRGGAVEHTRHATQSQKATLILSSFASALSRGSHSLLSLHETESGKSFPRSINQRENTEKEAITAAALFDDYYPVLPENGAVITKILDRGKHYELHRVPFVNGKPLSNPRFQRNRIVQEGVEEFGRWEAGSSFSNFMKAIGWDEATAFYEQLLIGENGAAQNPVLLKKIEGIFVEGISLLLEEKEVPLSRVQNIKQSFQALMSHLPRDVRGQCWARILAGIAQQQSLGKIVREATRPLGAAGAKLMQAIHSLTVGVDPTLEEATRLALDQTANFSLMDGLQFLGARGFDAFASHNHYRLLGQGSIRAGLKGTRGSQQDSAYLLVHARPSQPDVIRGIGNFIDDIVKQGQYFPLTRGQFFNLVDQAEEERTAGFSNHQSFRDLHHGQVGALAIPKIYEQYGDWARMELAEGVPYSSLSDSDKQAVAPIVLAGAFAQFQSVGEDGKVLVNPEMHAGNVLYDTARGHASLVDCGLIGPAEPGDLATLMQIHSGFSTHGLAGAAAQLFEGHHVSSLTQLTEAKRRDLVSGMKVLEDQFRGGTSPELLLSGLATLVSQSVDQPVSPGLDLLFRGLQHLAPYLRAVSGSVGFSAPSPSPTHETFIKEIEKARRGDTSQIAKQKLPKGIGLGQVRADGSVLSIGTITQEADPSKLETKGPMAGMLTLQTETGRRFVRPEHIRVQKVGNNGQTEWVTLDDFIKA